ncbi:MAG TPA: hypothetical protein VLT51_01045 [Anaerolineales bacterium]|nr:hypothetical protein [Anaerolineales bacterium]
MLDFFLSLSFPFSLSISGFPSLGFPALYTVFLLLLLFGSDFFMSRGREIFAWLMAFPLLLAVIPLWFAVQAGRA